MSMRCSKDVKINKFMKSTEVKLISYTPENQQRVKIYAELDGTAHTETGTLQISDLFLSLNENEDTDSPDEGQAEKEVFIQVDSAAGCNFNGIVINTEQRAFIVHFLTKYK